MLKDQVGEGQAGLGAYHGGGVGDLDGQGAALQDGRIGAWIPVRGLTSGGNSVRMDVSGVGVGEAAGVSVAGTGVDVEVDGGGIVAAGWVVRVGVGVTAFELPPQAEKTSCETAKTARSAPKVKLAILC